MMKKIAMLLALVLCVMMAGTAMAAKKIEVQQTTVPASPSGVTNNGEYQIMIRPFNDNETPRPEDEVVIQYIKEMFGNVEFKFMSFYASALKENSHTDIPENNGASALTKEFEFSFFGEEGIQRFMAFYYDSNANVTEQFVDYDSEITDDGVNVVFDHLTPVVFAWVPGITPVAAPLDVPQTGDSSSLPGLFILMGMSIAAMGAMKLRRRAN